MMGCVLVGVLAILGHCLRSLMINYAYAYNNAPDNSVIQKLSDQAALSTLSMGIAHEIRNPMSGILARLELIESKPIVTQKDVSKLAQVIKRNIRRILSITDSMLAFAGSYNPTTTEVAISDVMADIMTLTKQECSRRHITFTLDSHSDCFVKADPYLIHQIFLNIILNAIQSIVDEGAISVQIDSYRWKKSNGVKVTITDTGVGIDPSIKSRIFDPFFSHKKYGHAGLGLSTALNHISELNGFIQIKDSEKSGSIVTLFIPS